MRALKFANRLIFWHNRRFSNLGKWLAPDFRQKRFVLQSRSRARGLATARFKEKP
ncbi:hypothetical protein [Paraburkholderia ferrariae]|uniref:hypothetical protein n=1 Tax=Paraburkholderia ferrariae TaxID=386056 RepID=UPI0012EC07F0|nr:hypothetical protein [Paraburkholderia ferrariae]